MDFYKFSIILNLLWISRGTTEYLSLMSGKDSDFCITNSSSAMYRTSSSGGVIIEDYTNEYIPVHNFHCDFENENCLKKFELDPWQRAFSLNHENPPILDSRWESLKIKQLPFLRGTKQLEFLALSELPNSEYFRVPISLIGNEAHLLLCDSEYVRNANCYWFILQGWRNTETALRRCTNGQIKGLYPTAKDCAARIKPIYHPGDFPLYLSDQKWSHVIIERNNKELYLKYLDRNREETLIHFIEQNQMFELKYLMGHRKDDEVYCKIHENYYMLSTKVSEVTFDNWFSKIGPGNCISLMSNTCSYCASTITFTAENGSVLFEETLQPTNSVWTEKKIILRESDNLFMRVRMKTFITDGSSSTENGFWSFDDFRECHIEEYRITPKKGNEKISECRLLANNQIVGVTPVTDYIPENTCPSDTIGNTCISCDILQTNRRSCKNLKICESMRDSNVCYCSPGYSGNDCNKECPEGSYGNLCQNQCGFCQGKCDVSNGKCVCNNLFEGPTCKIPKLGQYLKHAPNILGSTAQSCELQWDSEDFIGKLRPQYYQLQYSDLSTNSRWWMDYGSVEEITQNEKMEIGNLKKNNKYGIRVLISDEKTEIKKLNYIDLPFNICNTTCNGWKHSDIIVDTASESAKFEIQLTEDECDVSTYKHFLRNEQGQAPSMNESTSLRFTIRELKPFTQYEIVFVSPYNTISKIFKTKEGVPSVVKDIKMVESTASYIKLSWELPETPKGDILYYRVQYNKLRRTSCDINSWSQTFEANSTITSIELNDLEPYSQYKIAIYAVNKLKVGEEALYYNSTQGLDHFKEEENLSKLSITPETSERGASFSFGNIQCAKLLGPLEISVNCSCVSEWCLKIETISNTLSSFRGRLDFKELQPYCQYTCKIYFCRSDFCSLHKNGTIKTKASVPNDLKEIIVTAAGDAFIDIRWLPPYPPTGVEQTYRITTKCENCYYNRKNTYILNPQKCSIWPEYYCHRLKDYIYYHFIATVMIEAANTENGKFRQVGYEKLNVTEKPPEKPYNLSVSLKIDNQMIIFWNHPNRTNGLMKYFIIRIANFLNSDINLTPSTWKLTYGYQLKYSLPPAEDFTVRISAVNNKYEGEAAVIKTSSYPVNPDLVNSEIHITNYTKNSISISLNTTRLAQSNPNVGEFLLILINDQQSTLKDPNLELLEKKIGTSFDAGHQLRVVSEVDLKKLSSNVLDFTIGNGEEINIDGFLKISLKNKPLQDSRYYNITLIVLNEYNGKCRYVMYNASSLTEGNPSMTPPPTPTSPEEKTMEESSGGSAAYALLLLLLLIPIIVVVIMKRKKIVFIRPTMSLEKIIENSTQAHPQSKDIEETILLEAKETVVVPQKPVMKVKPKLSIRKSTNPPNPPDGLYSKPIKMAEFEDYVRTSIESGELERQHALFPRGQTQPWQYGSTKINKPKNRYNNLVAYDHSRVVLKKIEGDEYSDYINANYIHGYNMERAYIATQGPKAITLNDFWRMIWQENVKFIVMLANIIEGGKKKVEQYWPNINEELTFQDVVVQYHSMELFANFEYRIFHVRKGNENRVIEQLHFTTWPDHGVPLYPQSLVPFIRKILKIPLSSSSPVVVHCSAGVGRTGTILLADIILRMAAKQGVVDLLNNLQKLREQRPNMVDNVEQYKLAHLVVLECLMGLQTSVKCDDDMERNVQRMIRDGDYKIQMNYLKETEWQDQAMKSVADYSEEFRHFPEKNRIQEIIPENQGRIFLSRYPHDDESSSYINAVQVDAFRCPGRFFVTQQPLPNTLGDFWRLVTERKINVIVSLNEVDPTEKTCCKFWPTPDDPELQPVDFILVTFNKISELEYYNIYSLHVWIKNEQQKEKIDVEIVAFKHWPIRTKLPSSCEEFLAFYEEADAISRRSSNVVVTCFDGVTASGVYVALSFIIEQMKLEHECDVCLAVRTIRHNRTQFINNEDQFLFLYECAVKFIIGFQSYANFQNQG